MSTGIKNGKLHSICIDDMKFIYRFALVILTVYFQVATVASSNPGRKSDGKWVIVIDAGHGGKDPGASGSYSKEKDITLAIALKTGEYLQNNLSNVKIIYTRNDDSFVELVARPKIANNNNADLFVSIHANWAKSKSVTGTESFIMGPAKDQTNLEVAMKENEVILLEDDYSTKYEGFDPKSPESYIMFTVMQNVFKKQSTDLASSVQTQFREKLNRKDRGVKQGGLWVLFNTTMPSILIETGFITNLEEEKFLNSKQGQDYISSAIYRACRDYIVDIDNKSNFTSVKTPGKTENAENTEIEEIKMNTEKTENAKNNNINVSSKQLYFTVQVATSSTKNDVKPDNFKGITDISELFINNRYKYTTGNFPEYSDAVTYRKKMEELFPDAFVIAIKDNKIIPLQEALDQNRKK